MAEPCSPEDCPYERICEIPFVGKYLGLKENEHYGTLRAVFEVDTKDPDNKEFLDIIEELREFASKHEKRVRNVEFISRILSESSAVTCVL